MYDDRFVPVDVEDADLQQRSVGGWSDEHRQVFIYGYPAHRRADGVKDVRVDNTVLPRRLTDSHVDNISCLDSCVNEYEKTAPYGRFLTTVTTKVDWH